MILFTIVWFLLVLSVLVIVHELGHFLAAKWMGVHVQEFGLGYPPRVKRLFKRWGTVFSLNAIPIGGFVKLYGDDAESLTVEDEPQIDADQKFGSKSQARRLIIILAGVVVNFIFGVVAFSILFSIVGIPTPKGFVEISEVLTNSPADEAGVVVGDQVLRFSSSADQIETTQALSLIEAINRVPGEEVVLEVVRDGQELTLTPQLRDQRTEDEGLLGVGLNDTELAFYPWWEMPFRGAWQGLQDSVMLSRLIVGALGDMFGGIVTRGEVPTDIAGPVGIVDQANRADIISQGPLSTIHFAGQLSVNLAIINLLPIPALDGGRAVFVMLESVIGRKRRISWEQKASVYGFLFLIGLIILVTAKDIVSIFR